MTPENYFSWRTEMQFAFSQVVSKADITRTIEQQMSHLGFDFYAFFIRHPVPFTRPKTFFLLIIHRIGSSIICRRTLHSSIRF